VSRESNELHKLDLPVKIFIGQASPNLLKTILKPIMIKIQKINFKNSIFHFLKTKKTWLTKGTRNWLTVCPTKTKANKKHSTILKNKLILRLSKLKKAYNWVEKHSRIRTNWLMITSPFLSLTCKMLTFLRVVKKNSTFKTKAKESGTFWTKKKNINLYQNSNHKN
jgi:hypothetical protein